MFKFNFGNVLKNSSFTFSGESYCKDDFIVSTQHWDKDLKTGAIFVLDYKGNVRAYKNLTDGSASAFKQTTLEDGTIYYSYLKTRREKFTQILESYWKCELCVLDSKFKEIHAGIIAKKYGSLQTDTSCDYHDYLLLDKDHYFIFTVNSRLATNIPNCTRPVLVANCIIQEQKAGEVVWQFETADYPELFSASIFKNSFSTFKGKNALDYAHLNSIELSKDGKYLYLSYRNIGLVIIEKETKKIVNIINSVTNNDCFKFQHDVRIVNENLVTLYDNESSEMRIFKDRDKQTYLIKCHLDDAKKVKHIEKIDTGNRASANFGGAILLNEEKEIWDISYSPFTNNNIMEEYSFTEHKLYCSIAPNRAKMFFINRIERGKPNEDLI